MTLDDHKKAVAQAWKNLRQAEAKAEALQREVQTAKVAAERAPLGRKRPLGRIKRALCAALAAEEHVRDQLRLKAGFGWGWLRLGGG